MIFSGMTEEQNLYVEGMLQMFETHGWKGLIEEIEGKLELMGDGALTYGVKAEEVYYAQGRAAVYRELLGLPSLVDEAIKQAEERTQDKSYDE